MYNVWVATDWHCWSKDNRDLRHPYRSVSNLGRLADNYAEEIQVDDLFIHLGDLCDPAVTDPKRLALIVSSIPCRKILCKGNHDVQPDEFYLQVGFDEVCDICKIGNIIFSHKPVRVALDEINIHGHLHTAKLSTLGSNYINAFRSNFDTHPVLVEDLLEKAPYQDPEDWRGTELYGVEKNFEQYMSVENDCYSKILDLTEEFDDYPLDEAAGPDDTLAQIVEFNQDFDKKFQYGLRINGRWDPKRNTTSDDWDKYLIIQSPEELEKSMVGVCWDCVSYEAWYFRKHFPKVPFKTYYMQFFDGADYPSHTILTFTLKGKHYYFEISFRKFAGVYEARSEEDIINFVLQLMSDNPDPSIPKGELLKKWKCDAWEYDALDPTLYGMHCQEYMDHVMGQGKCLHHTWHKHRHPVTRIDTSSLTESIAGVLDEVLFEDPGDTEYWEQDDDYKPSAKIKEPMADGESGIVSESLNPDQIIRQIRPYLQEGLTFPVIIPPEYTGVVINSHVANMLPQILPMLGVAWLTKLVLLAVTTASIIESQLFAIDVIARKSDNSENVIFNGPGHIRNMEVCAVADGTIHAITSGHSEDDSAVAKLTQIFGNCIVIKHSLCMYSIYAHLASVKYKVGAKVRAGQVIGTVGSTGNSSEPHLHFQVCVTDPSVAVLTGTLHQLTPLPNIFLNSVPVRFRGISYAILPGTTASIQASTRDATWSYADASNPIGMSDPMKIYLVRVGAINESVLRSSVDKDHEQKGRLRLSQFAQYALTKERRKKYQPEFPNLRHFYDHGEKSHDSIIWVDNNDHPVAAVSVYYEKDDPHAVRDQWSGHNWIAGLEIAKDYRGYGLAKQVLHYAVCMLKADALGVADDNKLAQKVYLDYGFKMSNDTSGRNHMMYLDEDATYRDSESRNAPTRFQVKEEPTTNPNDPVSSKGVKLSFYLQGEQVGEASISAVDTTTGFLYDVEVFPKFRGKGYGTEIMRYIVTNYAVTELTVEQSNTKAIKLYEKFGFTTRKKFKENGKPMYDMQYGAGGITEGTVQYYIPPILTEDSDFHEMDPKAKRSLMDKHGLKTPGQEHEYSVDPDADEETDPEKRLRERKEKRLKNLKKARKIKKRKAFVRKLKSHLPGVKNEEVETDPFNGDQERFFEPPDHYAEYVRFNESFHFEMLDDVKFLDPISETSDADKRLCPVYILLIRGNSPVSALISGFTQSVYTHVSISFDPTLTKMYSFAAKDKVNTLEALIGGFKIENIQGKFFKENKIPYAVYVVPSTQDEITRMKKRLTYFIRNETKFRFDYGGLVKNYFKIEDYPENRWFCSRFVGEILNAGRPDRPYVDSPALLRPEDFRTISFARFVESGMDAAKYNASRVEKKTKAILREESLKYLSKIPAAVNESIVYDVDPLDLLSESVVEYLIAQLDESAFQDFLIYLQSFKVKFDKDGNVIISRREIDQLDQRFRQTVREARAYQAAGNIEGMKECLAQTYFMIELINRHYLNPKTMQSNRVKADLKKEMTDLRSVMLNMFQRNLKWVTAREPQFNFQEYYDGSKYGKNMYIPKEVVTALGTTLVTALR